MDLNIVPYVLALVILIGRVNLRKNLIYAISEALVILWCGLRVVEKNALLGHQLLLPCAHLEQRQIF